MTGAPRLDKRALIDAALVSLAELARAARASATATREAATHVESRAENDKDTRGLEASYLARGQAMRVEELEEAITRLRFLELRRFQTAEPIGLGAVVTVRLEDERTLRYFLVSNAGGTRVTVDGVDVQLVTPAAPLGRALVDKGIGDELTLRIGGRVREYEIVAVE